MAGEIEEKIDASEAGSEEERRKKALGRRIDAVGWALFFITMGILWFVAESHPEFLPQGVFLIIVGAIMLAVNVVRRFAGVPTGMLGVVLGFIALAFGVCSLKDIEVPVFPVILILVGVLILAKHLFNVD